MKCHGHEDDMIHLLSGTALLTNGVRTAVKPFGSVYGMESTNWATEIRRTT
jgi:uncharacterized cupin superfamily protein